MKTTHQQHATLAPRRSAPGVRRPTSSSNLSVQRSSPAFTLIEMLIVISVISVLLGLLYGALERARTFSRRAIAYTEVKNIEAALKQYYAHYHTWPPTDLTDASVSEPTVTAPDKGFTIGSTYAIVLEGKIANSTTDTTLTDANPDRVSFIEFTRKNSTGVPINPFRLSSSTETRQYKVAFDLDNDSKISFTAVSNTTVYASLAVWTEIPGSTPNNSTVSATVDNEVIGSWTTFSK